MVSVSYCPSLLGFVCTNKDNRNKKLKGVGIIWMNGERWEAAPGSLLTNARVLTSRPGLLVNFKVNCIMTLTEPTCFLTQTGTCGALDAADTWRRPHNGHWTPGHCILIMRTETKIAWISSWVSSLDSFKVNLIHQGAKKFYWSQDSITDGCLV